MKRLLALMNTRQRRRLMTAAALLGLGLWSSAAEASGNNPDSVVVSVTPGNITYGVSIASPMTSGYQFGSQNLSATTISTVAIVVTNSGNIAEFFAMKVSSTTPDNWAPVSGVPGPDQFRLMAYLNTGAQPSDATFLDALTGGIPTNGQNLYGQGTNKTNAQTPKNLWLRLTMPSALIAGSGGAQTMTIFINGQSN